MENLSIGSKLSSLRENLSLTQDEVSKNLGISNKTLSKWELGASEPNLEMLTKLAKYYNVSTDYILGIKNEETITCAKLIEKELSSSDFNEAILKSFELSFEMLCSKFQSPIVRDDKKAVVPSEKIGNKARSFVHVNEEFEMFVNTDDISMFVQLLGNRNNFAWLGDKEKQEKMAKLFSFLSQKDALNLVKLFNTNTTSKNISPSFVGQKLDITEQRATEILDEACEIALCYKKVAHFKDKDVNIYVCDGSGKILSIVTLAYEYMCSECYSEYANFGECRLIEGENV